jgi:trigger factor
MQTTQIAAVGLTREYQVVFPVADLESRLNDQLATMKDKVRINGFRPGKVPLGHVKRLHGRALMADVVQNAVNEASRKIVDENKYRLAFEPQVKFPEDQAEIEAVMDAKRDLAFTIALEVLPTIELKDLSAVTVVQEVSEPAASEVEEALTRMAKQNRTFLPKADSAAAEDGDRVTVDFVGTMDGVAFEGGSAQEIQVELGSNTFIPGFEEQLLGVKAGDVRTIEVTFPPNYMAEHLAARDASFVVTVKALEAPAPVAIDDNLAKAFGMEGIDAFREAVKKTLTGEYDKQARIKVKKELLDALDGLYDFPLPPTLVGQEFNGVWASVQNDMKSRAVTFADEGKTEDEAKAEYQRIAERRVRLGLVLAEIGDQIKVQISDEEVSQALVERARQFPGQEKAVWEYYRKNPQALAELRAPLFEEKVVDHLLTQVKLEEKKVSREVLFNDEVDETPKPEKTKAKSKAKAKTEE